MLTPIPSTTDYPENPSVDLVVFDNSWHFLSETSRLAYNTSSFSLVVNVDGIKTLEEEETLPFTLAALAEIIGEENPE